jgi:short subunit dehydrogenase-like uncharacterized protein
MVFGATGFAGRLVAGYLAGHAPGGVRIGLAGRSARRLADVRAGLGEAASAWPLLAADSADPVSVAALARAARVVVTTVGPYRGQGLALVEACAAAGTDYADLSGEVLFIRDSIDRCHGIAAGSGRRATPWPPRRSPGSRGRHRGSASPALLRATRAPAAATRMRPGRRTHRARRGQRHQGHGC